VQKKQQRYVPERKSTD